MQSSILNEQLILSKTKQQSLLQVTKLNLWGQNLQNIDILNYVPNLQILSLSINNIKSLKAISQLSKLKELYLRKNQIDNIDEVKYLKNLSNLDILWLSENPIENQEFYREKVIQILPHLRKLDNKAVTQEEVQFAQTLANQTQIEQQKKIQQENINKIFNKDNVQITNEKSPKKNPWIKEQNTTATTQKKKNSLKTEFEIDSIQNSQPFGSKSFQKNIKNNKESSMQIEKDQRRNSNLLTAIMILVEELSPYEKQILKQQLDKKQLINNEIIKAIFQQENFD